MRSRYTLWLKLAIAFMFITGAVHGVGLFASPEPTSETERHMRELMSTYRLDIGDGFRPTMSNLLTALSSCFTFICVLGGTCHEDLTQRTLKAETAETPAKPASPEARAWLRQAASFALSDLSAT